MKKVSSRQLPQQFIEEQLNKISSQSKGIVAAKDIACLHDVRVATRRLRSAFWIFRPELSKQRIEGLRKSLRAFAKATGQARDLDVHIAFVKNFKKHKKSLAYAQGLGVFAKLLEAQRKELQPAVVAALGKLQRGKTLAKIQAALDELSHDSAAEALAGFCAMGKTSITKRLKGLRKHEDAVYEPHNVKALHRLRIAAKKLHYTLESFESLFGKDIIQYRDAAHRLQRILGSLHDFDVRIESLPCLTEKLTTDKALSAATDYLHARYKKQRQKAYEDLVVYWKQLSKEKIWNGLINYIHACCKTLY